MIAYVKLELLKIKNCTNHFAIKGKLYLKAIQAAFKELQNLKPKGTGLTLKAQTDMPLLEHLLNLFLNNQIFDLRKVSYKDIIKKNSQSTGRRNPVLFLFVKKHKFFNNIINYYNIFAISFEFFL